MLLRLFRISPPLALPALLPPLPISSVPLPLQQTSTLPTSLPTLPISPKAPTFSTLMLELIATSTLPQPSPRHILPTLSPELRYLIPLLVPLQPLLPQRISLAQQLPPPTSSPLPATSVHSPLAHVPVVAGVMPLLGRQERKATPLPPD